MDPADHSTTHVVVASRALEGVEVVVPADGVAAAAAEEVRLAEGVVPEEHPTFDETAFVALDERTRAHAACVCEAAVYPLPAIHPRPDTPSSAGAEEVGASDVPAEVASVGPGTKVVGLDGERIGRLQRVVADPDSGGVSHLVVGRGVLRRTRRLVPVGWIEDMMSKGIRLGVSAATFDLLPPAPQAKTTGMGAATDADTGDTAQR
jgi:hypothetical protein